MIAEIRVESAASGADPRRQVTEILGERGHRDLRRMLRRVLQQG